MTAKDFIDYQENLSDVLFVAEIVAVDSPDSKKYGEAQIRIESIHGDKTITSDADLPFALFYSKASTESFGTFDVGDKVMVSFINGNPASPVIEGKVFDLEKINEVVPEYSQNYGKVKGLLSKSMKAAIFFNEAEGTINIRFLNGASIVIKNGEVFTKATTINIQAEGEANIKSQGNLNLESSSLIKIKAPMIQEN